MTTADHFLELSIPTRDVQESLAFYRLLGFGELETGEIRTYYYAVVTDGKIALGLHGSGPEEPAIAFVRPNLADHLQDPDGSGLQFLFQELGVDRFHEVGFYSPDGQLVRMMEARTFSPAGQDSRVMPVIGQTSEISFRTRDFPTAIAFWEERGFVVDADDDDYAGRGHVRLLAPGITIGLRDNLRWTEPTLRFEPDNTAAVIECLKQKGIEPRPTGDGFVITAPEGTRLVLIENTKDNSTVF
jgi:catechol 2,3-dioxygenase-like lactoylglutathione lyase family enzyme